MHSEVQLILVCAECGVESEEGARGWRAFLSREDERGEVDGVEVFCRACAKSEFGEA